MPRLRSMNCVRCFAGLASIGARGSHHIFRKHGVEERINLQRDGGKAKVYQVRQVRLVVLKHRLEGVE